MNIINFVNKLFFFTILCGVVVYVAVVNDLAVKGIALQDFKKEKSNLVEEQKTLEIETTKLKSFVFLNDKVASSGLINAGDVEYIQISPHDKVAQR